MEVKGAGAISHHLCLPQKDKVIIRHNNIPFKVSASLQKDYTIHYDLNTTTLIVCILY